MDKSIASVLSSILGYILGMLGIVAAWIQSQSLFARFAGSENGSMWPYMAATMIEGGIVYGALVLMARAKSWSGAIALLLFFVNTFVSIGCQIVEAAMVRGLKLDHTEEMLINYFLPASVVAIASVLWMGEIGKARAGATDSSDERSSTKKNGPGFIAGIVSALRGPEKTGAKLVTMGSDSPMKIAAARAPKKAKAPSRKKGNG